MKGHEIAVRNGDSKESAIAEHCYKSGHQADWSAAADIDSCGTRGVCLGHGTFIERRTHLTETRESSI